MALNLKLKDYIFDEGAVELGVYFLCLLICMILMLGRLRGKPSKLNNWLLTRRLDIFKDDVRTSEKVSSYLYLASILYIWLPVIVLIIWCGLIIYSNMQEKRSLLAPLAMLIVGLSVIALCVGIMKIKWNNFRFKMTNIVYVILALVLFTFYEALMIFGFEYTQKFFPYSAFFLNFNVIFLTVLVYLTQFNKDGENSNLFKTAFPTLGVAVE